MASTVFITATQARQTQLGDMVVHEEARGIESAILQAVSLGYYEVTVNSGTPMTQSTGVGIQAWTVDISNDSLYIPNHGLGNAQQVTLSSTGNLPVPLQPNVTYWVIYQDQDHILLAASFADAMSFKPMSLNISEGVTFVTLTSPGTGYLAVPAVSFQGGNPNVSATASATLSTSGGVFGVAVMAPGAGFTDIPTVEFNGQGSGANVGNVFLGSTQIIVNAAGVNYRVGDLVSVTGGVGIVTQAVVQAVDNAGTVVALGLSQAGSYSTIPTLTAAPTTVYPYGGTGLTVNLVMGVVGMVMATGGVGYSAVPDVLINSLTGYGASAQAATTGGAVTSISMLATGQNYQSIPNVTISSGDSAAAVAVLQATGVGNISIIDNGGNTYTTAPSVIVTAQGSGSVVAAITMTLTSSIITNAGTGYVVDDTLLVSGGVASSGAVIIVTKVGPVGNILESNIITSGSYTVLPQVVGNLLQGGTGTGAASSLAWSILTVSVTPGSSYAAPPIVTVTNNDGTGKGAVIVSLISSGMVTGVLVQNGGQNYTVIPTITLSAGNGATASATLVPSSVYSVMPVSTGNSYTYASVIFSADQGGGAIANAIVAGGQVTGYIMISGGGNYVTAPSVSIQGDGIGATASAALVPTPLASIQVTNSGVDFNSLPIVSLSGAGNLVASLQATGIDHISVTSPGEHFHAVPTITFISGSQQISQPIAPIVVTSLAYTVSGIQVVSGGLDYQSVPVVVIGSPGTLLGNTATATASIGSGSGTFYLQQYMPSTDYYKVWKGQAPSDALTVRPYQDQMQTIMNYFTALGYNINRLTNSATGTTLVWNVKW